MAELSAFSYLFKKTPLHGIDARCKLLSLAALSLTAIYVEPRGLFLLCLAALTLTAVAGLLSANLFRRLRHLLFFLMFVWAARALFTPGEPLVRFSFLSVTREGVLQGALLCARMGLVVLFSLVFSSTTQSARTREALERLLRPLPFVPGKQIAVMMGLMTRFIPVVLDRIGETVEAQRSRGVENRKNPLYRMKNLAVPLLTGLFWDAQVLSDAMEARCYSQGHNPDPENLDKKDWAVLAAVLFFCLLCLAS